MTDRQILLAILRILYAYVLYKIGGFGVLDVSAYRRIEKALAAAAPLILDGK